jgi:uncharacterized repeat protein (TIGR01451 family)
MRKLYLFSIILFNLVVSNIHAQDVSLPDGEFRNFLLSRYPGCFINTDINGQLMLNTTCAAITTEDSLEFHNLGLTGSPIDLTGLQYFTSLVYLNCTNNQILTYVYPPNLKFLDCSTSMADSPFGVFPAFPNSLETLICKDNVAGTIPFSPNLKYIDISGNFNYNMAALPNGLLKLICKDQSSGASLPRLTTLPALPASLRYLDCSNNQLSTLPALPASLDTIICSGQFGYQNPEDFFRSMTILPALPPALSYLDCRGNKLTNLPSLPATLKFLNCSSQRVFAGSLEVFPPDPELVVGEGLSSLPVLPNGLLYLSCRGNKLTSLPSSLPPNLTYLDVSYNVATFEVQNQTQGIQCLPHLPATLTTLITNATYIGCYPNSGSYTATPTRPLCSPVNNANQCVSFPIVSGDVFYDNNSNGTRELGENSRSFVEVNLTNGQTGYTDLNGHFEFTADIGSNTVSVVNPVYYTSVPASRTYSIANYTDIVNDNYALQPNVSIDSILLILATTGTARPGFTIGYHSEYENIGTTVVTPQLSFRFDNSRMVFEPTGSVAGATVAGNTVTIPGSLVGPGDRRNFNLLFRVNSTVALGDTIRVSATSTVNSNISTDSLFSIVRGAFDPNDKRATPKLTPEQVQQGAYINYLVRFQNTGTDTAFNVVVSDVLSNLLDAASFQMLGSSHNCKVTRNGSTVYFEFLNILLPDSNINEPASHGWIRFRIKPVSSVPLNSVIPNSVGIYFDYNAPVITNIANTTIALATVPLNLLSFRGMTDASGKNALLTWETSEERNTAYFEIQSGNDGTRFEPVGNVRANGSGSGNYRFVKSLQQDLTYFRLKMVDIDGRFTYSPVVKVRMQKPGTAFAILTNPVKQKMIVEVFDESLFNSVATIVDNTGRVMYSFTIKQNRQDVDVRNLATGIYYVRTNLGSQKILVSK